MKTREERLSNKETYQNEHKTPINKELYSLTFFSNGHMEYLNYKTNLISLN